MTQRIGNAKDDTDGVQNDQVIDFKKVREKRIQEKQRNAERIFFKNLLSVYSIMENTKLIPIDLIEVSEEGCSFQIPYSLQNQWPKKMDEIPIRLYFSADTYFEINVKIQNSSPSIDGASRLVRFGCLIDKTRSSYPTYQHFVRFLKLYAEHSHRDNGNLTVLYF